MVKWYDTQMDEAVDRLRRMETRLTKYMASQGFDTQTTPPLWRDGRIIIPNIVTSVKDVLDVIPLENHSRPIPLVLHGKVVAYIQSAVSPGEQLYRNGK